MKARKILRISAPIMAVSLVPLAVGVSAAIHIHLSQKSISDALALNVTSMRSSEEIAINMRDVRTHLERYLQTKDPAEVQAIPDLRRDTDYWLTEAERTAVTERELELIDEIKKAYAYFFIEYDRIAERQSSDEFATRLRELNIDALTNAIITPAQEFLDFNEQQIAENSADNQHMTAQVVLGLTLLGVCGPIAGLLAGFGISRGVNRSLVRLSVPIRDAAGKLDEVVGPLTFAGGGGVDELEAVLHRMAGQIGSVIERLQRSQREALRAEQLAAVGQMAAGIAHELRNPLMSMKILVQSAAAEGNAVSLGRRDLAVLEEEIIRLERLTRTFLDFARPPQLDKRPFELQTLLLDTVALLSGRADEQEVRIHCQLPPAPVLIEADCGQIRQVVLNLLLNALEAMPHDGQVWVRLETTRRTAAGPRSAVLHVIDSGPGLPADLGQEIFTPFVSTKATGIGLGLSICKRIVEAHGGEITASNRPEGGATFSVRLSRLSGQEARTHLAAV
jgi:two-component system, NtrC family, sensor histidine kinase HydH